MVLFDREKFRQFRKQKKFTMDDVASRAEIHRVTLSVWERGLRVPTEKNLRALAHAINVPVSKFSNLKEEEVSEGNLSEFAKSLLAFSNTDETERDRQLKQIMNFMKLKYSEYRQTSIVLKAILSSMKSVFYVKDSELKYIVANNSFLNHFSLNPGFNVLGKKDENFFNITEAKINTELDQQVIISGKPVIKLQGYIPGTRKKRLGYISKLPIYDTEQKIAGIVSFFVDMTEEMKMEENSKMLEAALQNSSDVVWLVSFSPKKEIIFASDSVEQLYGYPLEKFKDDISFWWDVCVYPEDKTKLTDYRNAFDMKTWIKNESESKRTRYRIIDAEGNIKWIEETMFRKKYLDIDCLCFIERNITEQMESSFIKNTIFELFDKSEYYNIWLLELIPVKNSNGIPVQFHKKYLYFSGNKHIEQRYGYSKEQFEENPGLWYEIIHPEDKERIESEIYNRDYPKTIKYRIVRPNGSEVQIEDYLLLTEKESKLYILGISKRF